MRFTLAYVGIQVRNLERSISFYRDVMGMQVVRRRRVPETGGEWAELRSPGSQQLLELNWYPEGSKFFKGPYRNGHELDHIAFECEDVERSYRELLAKGAGIGHPPFAEEGLIAYVEDPDGIWIELNGPVPGDHLAGPED
jgi:lactoylglutathione lyase